MADIQNYGLKFPFTTNQEDNYFVDVNKNGISYVKSQIMHVLFTLKGSKIRDPEFGTNLLHYIYDSSDETTWAALQDECRTAISKYVNGCNLQEIVIMQSEDNVHEIYVKITFTANIDGENTTDTIVTKL
jgi:phage baseplate assembly protein W